MTKKGLYRLIDANLNRASEGLRVVEDIYRYVFNDKSIAMDIKIVRHRCKLDSYDTLVECRDIENDPLKNSTKSELDRENIQDIIIANFKRTAQSFRVLEEVLKLNSQQSSNKFKFMRYKLYHIEKKALRRFLRGAFKQL